MPFRRTVLSQEVANLTPSFSPLEDTEKDAVFSFSPRSRPLLMVFPRIFKIPRLYTSPQLEGSIWVCPLYVSILRLERLFFVIGRPNGLLVATAAWPDSIPF